MDSKILTKAIKKAIQGGAIAAPTVEGQGQDWNYVRSQTDVGIDPAVLETYLADLRIDPDVAVFDRKFANTHFGGGVSVGLPNIAKLLLAQAIATEDVSGTVERFKRYCVDNFVEATAVMAVSGVKIGETLRLGTEVSLVPMTTLPPSSQRGMALAQDRFGMLGPRFSVPCALTTRFRFGPVFYCPKEPQPPDEMAAHVSSGKAQTVLEEAFDLLSVFGVYPDFHMFWIQPDDFLMSGGASSGWQSSRTERRLRQEIEIPTRDVEALAAAYFSLDPQKRSEVLRIPLDRLGRAGREDDLADRSIDLGIALESLLLHDIKDRGELRFRLSLRGARLIGSSDAQRLEIQRSLKGLYDLRSGAVHSGFVARTEKTVKTIARATELCQMLIKRVIELKCEIDWQTVEVGGAGSAG